MPRGGSVKTYGRAGQDLNSSRSRAFDSMIQQDSTKPSISLAAPKTTKWGQTCFTKTRIKQDYDSDLKRRKVDNAQSSARFYDPEMDDNAENDVFNFDSDDDKKTKKSSRQAKVVKMPASGGGLTMRFSKDPDRISNEDSTDMYDVKPIIKPTKYKFFTSKKNSGKTDDDAISLESFNSDSGSIGMRHDNTDNISNNSAMDMETNEYTHIPITTQSVKSTGPSAAQFGFEVSDAESETEEIPDSGDPEIVFSSPAKRALEKKKHDALGLAKLFEADDDTDAWDSSSSQDNKASIKLLSGYGHSPYSRSDKKPPKKNPRGSLQKRLSNKLAELEGDKNTLVGTLKRNGSGSGSGGSFTRRLLTSPQKKVTAKAVYNPRQWGDEEGEGDSDDSSQPGSQKLSQPPSQPKRSKPTATYSNPLTHEFDDDALGPTPRSVYGKVKHEPGEVKREYPVLKRVNRRVPSRGGDGEMVSAVKVSREHKPLFTVVHNVKEAHEVQEHGENQEFLDDMEYIMAGLPDTEATSVRCLSTMSLVSKCTEPSFRMHLRAHDVITTVFSALHNAPDSPSLALCTAAVMFMCSRDHLTMDLDKQSLELMLQLLSGGDSDEAMSPDKTGRLTGSQKDLRRLHGEVCKACEIVKKNGSAKHLNMQDISTGSLAMEALLSLTSKRAGDWFKEELRALGGLDHLVNTVSECLTAEDEVCVEPTDDLLNRFKKIERCLRVLENVTYMNVDNQNHLIMYKTNLLIETLSQCLRVCEYCLPFNPVKLKGDKTDQDCVGFTVMSCMMAALRVLINLTHDSGLGCNRTGQQPGLIQTVVMVLLKIPQYLPEAERFDILVLGLGLLINMVEHFDGNKHKLLECTCMSPCVAAQKDKDIPALIAFMQLFLVHYKDAILAESEVEQKNGTKPTNMKRGESQDSQGGKTGTKQSYARVSDMRRQLLEQRDSDPSKMLPTHPGLADASGEWRESDSGIEWVSNNGESAANDSEKTVKSENTTSDIVATSNNEDGSENCDATAPSSDKDSVPPPAGDNTSEKDSESEFDIMASQENDESFTKALHKAGRHMEDSIVAAYVSLLIGCLIENNIDLVKQVRELLEDGNFEPMIYMLRKFLGFMNLITAVNNTGAKSIIRIIETLEAC